MKQILIFAPDLAEVAQRRRIEGLRAAGFAVRSVSFAKRDGQIVTPPDWPDQPLGLIHNEHLRKRAIALLRSIPRLWRARPSARDADLIIARNPDMLLLAALTRSFTGAKTPLIYECLDIHGLMTSASLPGRLIRRLERRLLRICAHVLVSSPGFIVPYFRKTQGYEGPCTVLENKLWFPSAAPPRSQHPKPHGTPLRLGWVGSLRCRPSFELLLETARRMGPSVRIDIHGQVHGHALPDFENRVAAEANVHYHGPYAYPGGLESVYRTLDLVWAQDLWQSGTNSDWLLPNRLYEAGWFGCPAIAVEGTETARRIRANGQGWRCAAPTVEALIHLLSSLTPEALAVRRAHVRALPDTLFRITADDYRTLFNDLIQSSTPRQSRLHAPT